jgi:threonine/homoserine/homoserine lactone efflux protein
VFGARLYEPQSHTIPRTRRSLMQSFQSFLIAAVTLLLTPGPTNTLLALAGAKGGATRVLRLLPASLLGYACGLVPVVSAGATLFSTWPMLTVGLKIGAALWVLVMAARLWRMPSGKQIGSTITFRDLFLTTLLNPKVLVFGLLLLPPLGAADFSTCALALVVAIAGTGLLWGLLGGLVLFGEASQRRKQLFQRVASVWLACLAVTLLGTTLGA